MLLIDYKWFGSGLMPFDVVLNTICYREFGFSSVFKRKNTCRKTKQKVTKVSSVKLGLYKLQLLKIFHFI